MAINDVKYYQVKIQGVRPLIMHCGQLADPLNKWTKLMKEVTSKKSKTDADHEEMGRIEFQGGLYYDEIKQRPVIFAECLDALMKKGAAVNKKGKAMAAGVEIADPYYPLTYEGPKDRVGLWNAQDKQGNYTFRDRRGVRVQRNVVIRTRPRFDEWSLEFRVALYPFSGLNPKDIEQSLTNAGAAVGLGDYRPRFGLFTLENFEEVRSKKAALQI